MEKLKQHREVAAVVVVLVLAFATLMLPTAPLQNTVYIVAVAIALGWLYDYAWWRIVGAAVVGAAIVLGAPYALNGYISEEGRVLAGAITFGAALSYVAARWWTIRHPGTLPPAPHQAKES